MYCVDNNIYFAKFLCVIINIIMYCVDNNICLTQLVCILAFIFLVKFCINIVLYLNVIVNLIS